MAVQRANIFRKVVEMTDQSAIDLATKWFGLIEQDIEAKCGRFTKGKNKGKLRGWIVYTSCTEGGWVRGLGVVRPGTVYAFFCPTWDDKNDKLSPITCTTEMFLHAAKRVDSNYGHNPNQDHNNPADRQLKVEKMRNHLKEQIESVISTVLHCQKCGDKENEEHYQKMWLDLAKQYNLTDEGVLAIIGEENILT